MYSISEDQIKLFEPLIKSEYSLRQFPYNCIDIYNGLATPYAKSALQSLEDFLEGNMTYYTTVYRSILAYKFASCYYLSQVSLPSCSYIHIGAFKNCINLEYIDLPYCKWISEDAFYMNYSLNPKLSYANLPRCEHIHYHAFEGCTNLTSLSAPQCKAVEMYAFAYTKISYLDFPSLSAVLSNAFRSMSKLKTINIPNCKIVYDCGFKDCSKLLSIFLPSCSNIKDHAFMGCSSLSICSIPLVQYFGDSVFNDCNNLRSVYIGASFAVANIKFSSIFKNTPIFNSTYLGVFGSIYVPSSRQSFFQSYYKSMSSRFVYY